MEPKQKAGPWQLLWVLVRLVIVYAIAVGLFVQLWQMSPVFAVIWTVAVVLASLAQMARRPVTKWLKMRVGKGKGQEYDCAKCGTYVPAMVTVCPQCGTTFTATWRCTVSGVVNVLDGFLTVFWFLFFATAALVSMADEDAGVTVFLWVLAAVPAVLGILATVGGYYALQRRRWGWALAGAVAALLPFFPLGIASIILIATSRREFGRLRPRRPAT